MQLIMESEEFSKKKAELSHEVKEWKAKHKELERENGRLKIQLDMSMSPSKSVTSMQVKYNLLIVLSFPSTLYSFKQSRFDLSKFPSLQEEKYAKLVEQNKNLTEWREQLIEKNSSLTDENAKLRKKVKINMIYNEYIQCVNYTLALKIYKLNPLRFHIQCTHLEELVNEEETDINDVLEVIQTLQKSGSLPPGSSPISPMSAIGAKLRGLNHK